MNKKTIFYLAGYIFLMGIAGFLHTGAMMPVYINSSIAVLTTIFGILYFKNLKSGYIILVIWLALGFLTYGYLATFGIKQHPHPTVLTYFIFGSMSLFCIVTFIEMIRAHKPK